jgi:hypothetical protein
MAAGLRHIALVRTAQKTQLPKLTSLLRVIHLLPSDGYFSGFAVLALSKYTTIVKDIIIFVNYNVRKIMFLLSNKSLFTFK